MQRSGKNFLKLLADKIEKSTVAKLLVAASAVVAFILSSVNMGWSILDHYENATRRASIYLYERTSYPIYVKTTMEQILGYSYINNNGAIINSPKSVFPYYPVTLQIQNPSGQPVSIFNCSLAVRFYNRDAQFTSSGYISERMVGSNLISEEPIVKLSPGITKRIKFDFFFTPTPRLQRVLADKTTQAYRFRVTCENANGKVIQSDWR